MEEKNAELENVERKQCFQKSLCMIDGFFIIFFVFIVMNSLVGSDIIPFLRLTTYLPGGGTVLNQLLVQQLVQTILIVGLVLLFLHLRQCTLKQIGLYWFLRPIWLVLSILAGISTFFVMLCVNAWIIQMFPQWIEPQAITEVIVQARNGWEWFEAILVVSVLAPISEELLFRGYIYHSMRTRYGVFVSVLVTSLLFGCMHYDLFRLLPLTLAGVCLNLVSIYSGNVLGSILMHAVWNFMMIAVLLC